MLRKIAFIAAAFLALSIATASGPASTHIGTATILPEDCMVTVGEKLSLELDGNLPPNAVVTWKVNDGWVAYVLPGSDAVLVAPYKPAVITIRATISSTSSGRITSVTRQCTVTIMDDMSG